MNDETRKFLQESFLRNGGCIPRTKVGLYTRTSEETVRTVMAELLEAVNVFDEEKL